MSTTQTYELPKGVSRAEHKYWPKCYPEPVLRSLGYIATSFNDFCAVDNAIKNAKIVLEPSTVDLSTSDLSFIAMWGKATDIPYPYGTQLKKHFPKFSPTVQTRRNKHIKKNVLDAYGFLGKLFLENDRVTARIASGMIAEEVTVETHDVTYPELAEQAMIEIAANIQLGRPLRFNRDLQAHTFNGHAFVVCHNDDQLGSSF